VAYVEFDEHLEHWRKRANTLTDSSKIELYCQNFRGRAKKHTAQQNLREQNLRETTNGGY